MKKKTLNELVRKELNKLHEQRTQYSYDEQLLKKALEVGCIKKYVWFTPDPKPLRYVRSKSQEGQATQNIPVIYGKYQKTGDEYVFYANMVVQNIKTLKQNRWECDFFPKPTTSGGETILKQKNDEDRTKQEKKPLDPNQIDLLKALEADGWYAMDPAPSDFKIARGEYEKADLTKSETEEDNPGKKYTSSRYFDPLIYNNGFFVFKKNVQQPEKITKGEKVKYPMESCRIAINGLWKNLNKPRTFPLDDATRLKYEEIARGCQERTIIAPMLNKRLKELNL